MNKLLEAILCQIFSWDSPYHQFWCWIQSFSPQAIHLFLLHALLQFIYIQTCKFYKGSGKCYHQFRCWIQSFSLNSFVSIKSVNHLISNTCLRNTVSMYLINHTPCARTKKWMKAHPPISAYPTPLSTKNHFCSSPAWSTRSAVVFQNWFKTH